MRFGHFRFHRPSFPKLPHPGGIVPPVKRVPFETRPSGPVGDLVRGAIFQTRPGGNVGSLVERIKNARRWSREGLSDDVAAPGVWESIGKALSGVVSTVAPIYTAGIVSKAQASSLKQQATLYTPQNIQTLYNQQQFEAAQRGVDLGRSTGSTSAPIPWVPIGIAAAALVGGYFIFRKK